MPSGLLPLTPPSLPYFSPLPCAVRSSTGFTEDHPLSRTPPMLPQRAFRTLVNSHINDTNYIDHSSVRGYIYLITYMEMNHCTRLAVRQLCYVFLLMNLVSLEN